MHRTQFVGRITSPNGSTIDFETTGYFVPRDKDPRFWDLTSAVHVSGAKGPDYKAQDGRLGTWVGSLDTRGYVHHYRMILAPAAK